MLQIDHRESHDVDLFIMEPQFLPFLNPETQGYGLARQPDACSTDGATTLKLSFGGVGEIDFICCPEVTEQPTSRHMVEGHEVDLETPAEIIAKKVYYRGDLMQPRDMFDIAAVAEHHGDDYAVAALRACGEDRCASALRHVERMNPGFAQKIVGQLMYRERNQHLVHIAQPTTARLLRSAITAW